jgi:uncharacterized MAPEG superfamily protein
MTRDQRTVAIGAASGIVTMGAAMAGLYAIWPVDPTLSDVGRRLAYTAQAAAVAVLPLLVAITAVGNRRFNTEAIDPMLHKEDRATVINGRVADNTLQQFALFLAATLALSATLSASQMRLIPAATIVFVVMRVAFWIGYRIHPLHRAFGMAATSYLNVFLLAFALWKMVS